MGRNGWAGVLLAAVPAAAVAFALWRVSVIMRQQRQMEREAPGVG